MAFCKNCGKQLSDGAKFCAECGAPTGQTSAPVGGRRTSFEGEIRKCPNCGEVLKAFDAVCPSCKYELRGIQSSAVVATLTNKLENATSEKQQITIIQNFPIPSTKEDIYELFIVARSNFDEKLYTQKLDYEDLSDAWFSLIKRCYEKAKICFGEQREFAYIEAQYFEISNKISKDIARINKKEKFRKNKGLIIFAVIMALVIAIGITLTVILLTPPKPIEIGFSNTDFEGESRSYVYECLSKKGFTNITSKEVIVTNSQLVDQMVVRVTINGTNTFNRIDQFEIDTPIIIEYYVKTKITIGKGASELKGENYEDVVEYLEKQGFTNIRITEQQGTLVNDVFYQNNDVFQISVDTSTNFKNTAEFYSDVLIIITVYKT